MKHKKIYANKIFIPLASAFLILTTSGCILQTYPQRREISLQTVNNNQTRTRAIVLRIVYGDDTIEQNYELRHPTGGHPKGEITNYEEGETLWRIMQRTFAKKGIALEYQEYGAGMGVFITKIGDKKNGDNGRYWQYFVNGEYAKIGVSNYKVNEGDVVEWKFTNDKLKSQNSNVKTTTQN